MVNLDVQTVRWTGFPGGPGTSTFYLISGTHSLTPLHDLYGGLLNMFPPSVNLAFDPSGPTIESLSGEMVGEWLATGVGTLTGTGTGDYAAGVGACVRWNTATVVDGRRPKGHTYFVPIVASFFDTNGNLDSTGETNINNAAGSFIASMGTDLQVWHRPRAASVKHPVKRDGSAVTVTSATALQRPSVLRTRRY